MTGAEPKQSTSRMGLCLSGGGFRATFFHLGVLKLLWDTGLLRNVEEVCSVSGGSILAGNLALNWKDYTRPSDEAAFYAAVLPLIRFGRSDLRGQIVRRSLLAGWILPALSRTRILEQRYSDLFSGRELRALPSPSPAFHFLATSLTTGRQVDFYRDGYYDGQQLHKSSDLPLGLAVAASSAFPPLFPPAVISRDRLRARADQFLLENELLTDGGVYDNIGVTRMAQIAETRSANTTDTASLV